MRDYEKLTNVLRTMAEKTRGLSMLTGISGDGLPVLFDDAADAIEELLTVCKEIAAFVIHYADEDNVSAEVLCRKLHKIGVVEKDGAWWALPEPPKEETK